MPHNNLPKYNRKVMGGGLRSARFLLFSTCIIMIIGFIAFFPMVFKSSKNTVVIRIPRNATEQMVNDTLVKYFGESYAKHTMRLMKLRKVNYAKRRGLYEIQAGSSPFNTMHRLSSGAQTPLDITINGYRSLDALAQSVASKLQFSPQELLAVLNDPKIMAEYGLKPEQALALFLDDTYEVYWTISPEQFVKKIGDNYNNVWNTTRLKKAKNLGLTPAEVMTICSITDEETNRELEKGRIARLYLNRLGAGMKLQADPTVRYALHDFTIRRVTEKHLSADSPYNTYKYEGLPPGPIRTTSKTTIDAMLDSSPSNDLYMCAKEDFSGQHNFATTYEEHLENARKYQQALDARGIK